jgi:hypothetical protein
MKPKIRHRNRLPASLIPKARKRMGQYFRQFIGGSMDGRIETCPFFARDLVKATIDKSLWNRGMAGMVKTSNIYRLTEPSSKPIDGATYLYEYKP